MRPKMAFGQFLRLTLLRYLGASVVALGADMGGFLVLLRLGVAAAPASALGYTLGIAVHWWLSAHAVFVGGVASAGPERLRQKALFVVSALVGLLLTTAIVGAGAVAGLDPRLAKIVAVGVSFAVTYVLRARLVFAA
jgi:putative flippase GtrA